jgi:hypothetical protein
MIFNRNLSAAKSSLPIDVTASSNSTLVTLGKRDREEDLSPNIRNVRPKLESADAQSESR